MLWTGITMHACQFQGMEQAAPMCPALLPLPPCRGLVATCKSCNATVVISPACLPVFYARHAEAVPVSASAYLLAVICCMAHSPTPQAALLARARLKAQIRPKSGLAG